MLGCVHVVPKYLYFILLLHLTTFHGMYGSDIQHHCNLFPSHLRYGLPLGNPLGPAVYTPPRAAGERATLHRNFTSGTFVIFTYDANGKNGEGVVYWGGKPPPQPSPPPPPPPATTVQCGGVESTYVNDSTFAQDDVTHFSQQSTPMACCDACAANKDCAKWAWHGNGSTSNDSCHLHGNQATPKDQTGTVAGVMKRTA